MHSIAVTTLIETARVDAALATAQPHHKMASLAASAAPRLVLHFDVNETIMVADPAGGDSFEDVLNKMLAKTTFVRRKDGGAVDAAALGDLEWRDGVPLDDDGGDPEQALWLRWEKPDDGSRAFRWDEVHRKTFTETFKRFAGIKQELATALRLPPGDWDACFDLCGNQPVSWVIAATGTTSRRWRRIATPSSRCSYGDDVGSMA